MFITLCRAFGYLRFFTLIFFLRIRSHDSVISLEKRRRFSNVLVVVHIWQVINTSISFFSLDLLDDEPLCVQPREDEMSAHVKEVIEPVQAVKPL